MSRIYIWGFIDAKKLCNLLLFNIHTGPMNLRIVVFKRLKVFLDFMVLQIFHLIYVEVVFVDFLAGVNWDQLRFKHLDLALQDYVECVSRITFCDNVSSGLYVLGNYNFCQVRIGVLIVFQ